MCFFYVLQQDMQERSLRETERGSEYRGHERTKSRGRREMNKECNVEGREPRGYEGGSRGQRDTDSRQVDNVCRPTEGFHWCLIER